VLLRCFCNGVHVCVCLVSLYYCLFSPLGHHRYVRSFPTRRSSDLHLLFDEKAVFTELNRKINTTFEIKVIPIEMDKQYTKDMLEDRKSTRLNSSHVSISYAVFCLKKKKDKGLHKDSRQQACQTSNG